MNAKTVVVGVDDSMEALAAARWAGRFAGETGAELQLLHAAASPETVSTMLPVPVGVSTAGLRRNGPAADTVLTAASAEATRWEPRPEVVSSLTVPDDAGPAGPAGPVVVAVVAVDAAGTSEAAVLFAFAEAARRGTPLVAVHVWPAPSMPSGAGSTAVMTRTRYLPDAALEALTTAVAPGRAAFPAVAVRERLLTGRPEQVVPDETADASLVVVGSRGRAPLTGLLLGSTSQALLRRSTGPVAVVRLPDES